MTREMGWSSGDESNVFLFIVKLKNKNKNKNKRFQLLFASTLSTNIEGKEKRKINT
jgi:hypothetical protein